MASYVVLPPTQSGKPRIKITVELGYDKYGKRIRKYKTVTLNSMSERTIKKVISEFEIEVATAVEEESVEFMTVAMFYEKWMNLYVKEQLSISSRDSYTSYFKNGILDELGKKQMQEVRTLDLVNFFKKQKAEKKRSLEGKYMALKSFFNIALKWDVIQSNPMNGVDRQVGGKRYKEVEFYDEEQLKQLFKVLDAVYINHALSIKLAALAGLRMAEIAGICMECINYKENTISTDKTLLYDNETKRFLLDPTKTKRPRVVHVPKSLIDELKLQEIRQKIKNGLRKCLDTYVG
ncbi:MAG: hypothetical protein ABS949_10160 [Solibacillus sp.]